MTGRECDDATGFGRDVGYEMGRAAGDVAARLYRYARTARWFDLIAVVLLAAVLPCCGGIWWPWPAGWFAVSLLVDLVMCRKLNPKRSRGTKS